MQKQLESNSNLLTPEQQEEQHKHEVKLAFFNYAKDIRKLFTQPTPKMNPFYKANIERKNLMIQEGLRANQAFLNQIMEYVNQMSSQQEFTPQEETLSNNRSKIKTTVKQFFRQWSSETPESRDYMRVVEKCKQYLKTTSTILVPGCGLGRLVFELVRAGFGAEGNQVTYFMLFGSNFIINCSQQREEFRIFPFLGSSDYYYNEEDSFRSIKIPDLVPGEELAKEGDKEPEFAIVGGQFNQVYKQKPEHFEGVATCFFLDTANNIFDYVDTIWQTLKKGGIWVNFGPLLYHYHQIGSEVSIQVSWQVLKAYIELKFDIIETQMAETTYCHDPLSQMKVLYNCISFVASKKVSQVQKNSKIEYSFQQKENVQNY